MHYILKASLVSTRDIFSGSRKFIQILSNPKFLGQVFDVIVDCTGFSSISELPLQWLRFCAEIVPKDIREKFMTARMLNPNSLAQRYFRRLYNFMAGQSSIVRQVIVIFDWWFRSCLLFICQNLRFCQAIAGGTSRYCCRSSLGNKSSFLSYC